MSIEKSDIGKIKKLNQYFYMTPERRHFKI